MPAAGWSTQQLAEFVAAVSAAQSEAAAALAAVERAAEALDADVAAIVGGGEVLAAVGYPAGTAPVAELEAVKPGVGSSSLTVPGVGTCTATASSLEHPPGATLVVARPAPDGLTREESGLLRGMARVASLTMRMLRVLDEERAAREELERLAREQAALRRVATLVAEAAPPDAVFSAVADEVAQLSQADIAQVLRYEEDGTVTVVGGCGDPGLCLPVGEQFAVAGEGVVVSVLRTGRPARAARFRGPPGSVAYALRRAGVHTGSGSPVIVEGRLWGVVIAARARPGPLTPAAERRIPPFTELVATAIANAQAQDELTASRARIVTTADETRRRIERDLHDGAQQRLVSLALRLRAAQAAVPSDLDELASELDGVAAGLSDALDELREFSRGIHPAILAEGGLAPALKMLARRSAVPVRLNVRAGDRLPEPIEVGAYYVVSEALANAAKHAGASAAAVEVEAVGGVLRVTVRDDGVGGADFAHGSGLVGLKDRVEALGGRISLESAPGAGTSVEAELPLTAAPSRSRISS
jgi:signal transduction histidine kinase